MNELKLYSAGPLFAEEQLECKNRLLEQCQLKQIPCSETQIRKL